MKISKVRAGKQGNRRDNSEAVLEKVSIIKKSSDSLSSKREHQMGGKNIFSPQWEEKAFEYIKKLHEQKLSYIKIAEKMNKEGWTGENGSVLYQPHISKLMLKKGYKNFERKPTKAKQTVVPPDVRVISATNVHMSSDLEREILELLQTSLSSDSKLRAIEGLIKSRKS